MSDASQELRDTLERLHVQLHASEGVSDDVRSQLLALAADIQQLLDKPGDAASASQRAEDGEPSLLTRLSDTEKEFEATHPTLSGIVGSIIDALGRMGI